MQAVDVAHLCYGGTGGHMAVVSVLSRAFAAQGISTGVLAVAPIGAGVDDRAQWGSVDFVEQIALRHRADISSMVGVLRAARALPSRVLVVHSARHALPVALARWSRGRAVRAVVREGHANGMRGLASNTQAFAAQCIARATVFLTAESERDYPLRGWPLPGLAVRRVIANGVELPASAVEPRDTPEPLIGMAGRFVAGKDFAGLLDALAELRRRTPARQVRVVLAGDGSDRVQIERRIVDLGLAEHVTMLGRVPQREMPAFYSSLDAFVLATDGEAFSNALLQAAGYGLPIIASAVEGVSNIFHDGETARLVPPRDPVALADAIDDVLFGDPSASARMGGRARELVAARYTDDAMAAAYASLFGEIDPDGPWATFRA